MGYNYQSDECRKNKTFTKCCICYGEGKVYHYQDKKYITCDHCNGKGKMYEGSHNFQYIGPRTKSIGGGIFGIGAITWVVSIDRCTHCGKLIEEDNR